MPAKLTAVFFALSAPLAVPLVVPLAAPFAAPFAASAQAVPPVFPVGEIEVGLTILPFTQDDILLVETFPYNDLSALQVTLSDRLGPALAEVTRDRIGFQINVNICGTRVITARIQHELQGAFFLFTSSDPSETDRAAALFRNPPCAEL